MIVQIAGMQRSGSTFSFNIARHALERLGAVHQEPANDLIDVLSRVGEVDHVLVKTHCATEDSIALIERGAAKAICTVRRPEDAIASWMDVFGFSIEESLAQFEAWIEMFKRIKDSALVVSYDEIEANPGEVATRVSRHIDPCIPQEEIAEGLEQNRKSVVKHLTDGLSETEEGVVDLGFSYYDARSFYHRGHVSSLEAQTAEDRISSQKIAMIRRHLAPYLDDEGELDV